MRAEAAAEEEEEEEEDDDCRASAPQAHRHARSKTKVSTFPPRSSEPREPVHAAVVLECVFDHVVEGP